MSLTAGEIEVFSELILLREDTVWLRANLVQYSVNSDKFHLRHENPPRFRG